MRCRPIAFLALLVVAGCGGSGGAASTGPTTTAAVAVAPTTTVDPNVERKVFVDAAVAACDAAGDQITYASPFKTAQQYVDLAVVTQRALRAAQAKLDALTPPALSANQDVKEIDVVGFRRQLLALVDAAIPDLKAAGTLAKAKARYDKLLDDVDAVRDPKTDGLERTGLAEGCLFFPNPMYAQVPMVTG